MDGARLGLLRGRDAVHSFGDVQREAEALAEGVGLIPLLARRTSSVQGADGSSYLQRMLTQDVAALAPDAGAPACLLNPQGRILGRLLLWREVDALRLDFDPSAAEPSLPILERYVIADDVTFLEESERWVRARLLGPGAPGALGALGMPWPEVGAIVRGEVLGVTVAALGQRFGARPVAELRLPREGAQRVLRALARVATPVGELALEIARVEEGVPAYGTELTAAILPNEARLEDELSWTKGCYPGQEPVVMAKHRGHPARLLVRLSIASETLPPPGESLEHDGRAVGHITTSVEGRDHGWRALGFVRFGLAQAGTRLLTATERGEATVLG